MFLGTGRRNVREPLTIWSHLLLLPYWGPRDHFISGPFSSSGDHRGFLVPKEGFSSRFSGEAKGFQVARAVVVLGAPGGGQHPDAQRLRLYS